MPTIPNKQQKVIVIDAKQEKKLLDDSKKLRTFAEWIRNSDVHIRRIILAIHDPDTLKFMGLDHLKDRNKVLIEVFFDQDISEEKQLQKFKEVEALLLSNGKTIVKSKFYKDPLNSNNNLGKIITTI